MKSFPQPETEPVAQCGAAAPAPADTPAAAPPRATAAKPAPTPTAAEFGPIAIPMLGDVEPLEERETETLPVQAHPGGDDRGDPVGHARHAETPEEVEKISAMEGFGASSNRRVPPPGSRHYIAGQPVDDEEWEKTEREANRLADAGKRQRDEAEKRIAENNRGDPNYHPADPDHRDPQAGGKTPDPNPDGSPTFYDKDDDDRRKHKS